MTYMMLTFTIIISLVYFNRHPKSSGIENPMAVIVQSHFSSYINVKILNDKNAYLLSELLNDAIYMSAEHDIEPIFNCTRSLRKYLEDHHQDLGYYNSGKNVIVYSLYINPCLDAVSTLQGHGLRKNDITKAFSKMINRVVRSSDYQKSYEWPFSFRNLVEKLEDEIPLAELYNAIYLTVYPKSSLN